MKPPICVHCKKPTVRRWIPEPIDLLYRPPIYGEDGELIGGPTGIKEDLWKCLECGKTYKGAWQIEQCCHRHA